MAQPSLTTLLRTQLTIAKRDGVIESRELGGILDTALDARGTQDEAGTKQALLASSRSDHYKPDAKETLERFLAKIPSKPAAAAVTAARKGLVAKPGELTGYKLSKLEAALSQTYGTNQAHAALLKTLPAAFKLMDFYGLQYVRHRFGAMNGHGSALQEVLSHHIPGAQLVDADFDGQLDATDLVAIENKNGTLRLRPLGEALRDRIKVGAAIVSACRDMDAASHDFALTDDQTFSKKYWVPDERVESAFSLKPGSSPSAALLDIFADPKRYKFECATAMVIVHYKALLDLLGSSEFDKRCRGLRIGPWVTEDYLAKQQKRDGKVEEASAERRAELKPGDYTYIMNWDVSAAGRDGGWAGENVIYLGGDLFYGHPFGIAEEGVIVDHLNTLRKARAKRSASMMDLQMQLDTKIPWLQRHR